jgi:hypothetical protein
MLGCAVKCQPLVLVTIISALHLVSVDGLASFGLCARQAKKQSKKADSEVEPDTGAAWSDDNASDSDAPEMSDAEASGAASDDQEDNEDNDGPNTKGKKKQSAAASAGSTKGVKAVTCGLCGKSEKDCR